MLTINVIMNIKERRKMKKIKTELISPPTQKTVNVVCPGCGANLLRTVGIDKMKGITSCGLCEAQFKFKGGN